MQPGQLYDVLIIQQYEFVSPQHKVGADKMQ